MNTTTSTLNFEYGIAAELDVSQLLTEQDQACFDEIQQILKKHQALNRFGVTLLEGEKLSQDNIRLETNSVTERTLFTQIIKKNSPRNNSIQTNWTLNTLEAVAACENECEKVSTGGLHKTHHGGSGSNNQ